MRAVKLIKEDDRVISIAALKGSSAEIEKRDEYLKIPVQKRLKIAQSFENAQNILQKIPLLSLSAKECFDMAVREDFIVSITEDGMGKCTSAYEYRITDRGGSGITNIILKTCGVISTFASNMEDEIIILTDAGTAIRVNVSDIRVTGRGAKGVRVINLRDREKVSAVAKIEGCSDMKENKSKTVLNIQN